MEHKIKEVTIKNEKDLREASRTLAVLRLFVDGYLTVQISGYWLMRDYDFKGDSFTDEVIIQESDHMEVDDNLLDDKVIGEWFYKFGPGNSKVEFKFTDDNPRGYPDSKLHIYHSHYDFKRM